MSPPLETLKTGLRAALMPFLALILVIGIRQGSNILAGDAMLDGVATSDPWQWLITWRAECHALRNLQIIRSNFFIY